MRTRNRMSFKKSCISLLTLLLAAMLSLGTLTSCARTGTDGETGEQSEKVEQGSQDETGDAGTYEGTEGLDFYPLPDGTYGVSKGKTGYLEDIVVPKTYNQKAVTTVIDKAFSGCQNLKSVSLPDGLTVIGDSAFDGCRNLERITIPESVTKIEAAFTGCDKLTQATGVSYVGKWAFAYENSSLTAAVLKEDTVGITTEAFLNCFKLQKVVIPSSVKYLGYAMFLGCPDSMTVYYTGTPAQWKKLTESCSGWNRKWNGTVVCDYDPAAEEEILDFGGKEIKMLIPQNHNQYQYFGVSEDGYPDKAVSQAVFKRTMGTENKLNVQISMQSKNIDQNGGEYSAIIRNLTLAGDAPALIVLNPIVSVCATEGLFYNLARKAKENHVNLEKSWYNQSFNDAAMVVNNLPFVSGDLTPYTWDTTSVLLCPDSEIDFSFVTSNIWTLEKLKELAESYWRINAESHGLMFADPDCRLSMLYSLGFHITKRNSNGNIEIKSNSRMYDISDSFSALLKSKAVSTSDSSARQAFMNGKVLFLCTTLGYAKQHQKEAAFNTVILPIPKQNKEQANYISSSGNFSMIAVGQVNDISAATATLETLSYYSAYYNLRKAYIEEITTDPAQAEILNLVIDSISPNFEDIWYFTNMKSNLYALCDNTGTSLALIIDSNRNAWLQKISLLEETVGNANN